MEPWLLLLDVLCLCHLQVSRPSLLSDNLCYGWSLWQASVGVIHASDPRGMKRQSTLFNFTLSDSSPEAAVVVPIYNRRDRRKLRGQTDNACGSVKRNIVAGL